MCMSTSFRRSPMIPPPLAISYAKLRSDPMVTRRKKDMRKALKEVALQQHGVEKTHYALGLE